MEQASHSIGIETGLRLAFRHPEYGRALLVRLNQEGLDCGADGGRIAAERAIDRLIQLCPINSMDEQG
jgi:hypothetical protein